MSTPHKPARWSDFDRYLKGEHLQGKAHTLTIARLEVEETHPKPGQTMLSPVLYFRETAKGLIVSPTNQDTLAQLFGDDIAGSFGQRITLEAKPLRVAGRDTLPIRIRPTATGAPSQPEQPAGQAATTTASDRAALFGKEDDF